MERTIEAHTVSGRLGVLSVAVTPDGQQVVAGCADGAVMVWDLDTGMELHTLVEHEPDLSVPPTAGAISITETAKGRYHVLSYCDEKIRVWDLDTGAELDSVELQPSGLNLSNMAVTRDGRRAMLAEFGIVEVWDLVRKEWWKYVRGVTAN